MSDSYDDYESKIQLAEHAWEQALEEKQEPKKQWVGLTDDEMEALFLNEDGVRFARYIEAKLKNKNS